MRCLVIEDEVDTSSYICNALRDAGYSPTAALTGDDGLAQALGGRWEVIIVDRMLSGSVVTNEARAAADKLLEASQ